MLFLLAGFDTPASAMGYLIHNLTVNQDAQDKLREEIKHAISKHVSFEIVMKP